MKDHAWINFEWEGKDYRYTGEWPEEMKSAIGDAHISLAAKGKAFSLQDMIVAAGGKILEVHSIRPDGSIQAADLADFYVI